MVLRVYNFGYFNPRSRKGSDSKNKQKSLIFYAKQNQIIQTISSKQNNPPSLFRNHGYFHLYSGANPLTIYGLLALRT